MISLSEMNQDELAESISLGEPDTLEYFKASVSDGFANTAVGVAYNAYKEGELDQDDMPQVARGSQNQAYENMQAHFQGRKAEQVEPTQTELKKRLTVEEWKNSSFYREGIKFENGYSENRAKFMAETYDENKFRAHTLNAEKNLGVKALGFAGQMIGSLPDPINFIPFGTGVIRGGTLAAKVAAGAIEGAVGNLAVSAITRPYWQDRGIDSTWQDYVSDLAIGGMLGGGFSALGHGVAKSIDAVRNRKNIGVKERQVLASAIDVVADSIEKGEQIDLSKVPELETTIKSLWEAPEVMRSQKVSELQTTLINDFAFSETDARISIAPLVAHAQTFSQKLGMDFEDFINTYGISKIEKSDVAPNYKKPKPESKIESGWTYNGEDTSKNVELSGEQYAQDDLYFQNKTKKTNAKGSVTFKEDGQRIVTLFESADKSTLLHETGHIFLDNMEKFAALENADASFKNELKAIKSWLGVKGDGPIKVVHHEKFARGLEQYLMEGRAPREDLQGAFDSFKEWFKSIYKSSDELKVKFNDDARDIYSKIMVGENKIDLNPVKEIEYEARFKTESDLDNAVELFQKELSNPDLKETHSKLEIEALKSHLSEIKADDEALEAVSEALTLFQSDIAKKAFDFDKIDKELIKKSGLNKEHFERLTKQVLKDLSEATKANEGNLNDFVISQAIEKRKMELAIEAKEKARQVYLNKIAKQETINRAQYLIENGATPELAILSQIEGESSLRGLKGAGDSVWGRYNSLSQSELGKMFSDLKGIDPSIEKLFMDDIEFNENVISEMLSLKGDEVDYKSVTGDSVAFQAARLLKDKAEKMRQRANAAGANIGKLEYEGWIPRNHDVEKIILQGSDSWIAYMRDNLDLEKSFPDLDSEKLDQVLYETYQNIITDVRKERGEFREVGIMVKQPRNIASSMAQSRKLHFKDASGELRYLKEYGQGSNILETMSRHMDMTSRKIALMETFGPNPDNTIATSMEKIRQEIRDKTLYPDKSDKERIKILEDLGDEQALLNREGTIGKSLMFALGEGDSFEAPRMKQYSQTIRAINSVAKLGAALLSQFPDMLNLANEHRIVRDNNVASAWAETFKNYFFKMTPEKQQVLDRLGVMADAINFKNFNRFEMDNLNNRLSRMNDVMFKISGQDLHVNKAKSGFALALSKDLGGFNKLDFNEIPAGFREALVQYGSMTPEKWELIRKLDPVKADGVNYFHPDLIQNLQNKDLENLIPSEFRDASKPQKKTIKMDKYPDPDTAGEAQARSDKKFEKDLKNWEEKRDFHFNKTKFELENNLRTFFIEETRNGALEPDLKIKRQITLGTKSGTYTGEALRLMTQFKSFAFAYTDRTVRGQRFNREFGKLDKTGVFHHVVASLALGYIAMSAKDLSKGIEPKDPTLPQTWLQAAFQSGGLGIMGDFVQGSLARTGADLVATLAGPTVTTFAQGANIAGKVAKETYSASTGDKADFGGVTSDVMDFTKQQIPFQSLWYSRAAIELLVWSHLKESLEPGSIRRTERRLKKEYNQKYILSPSQVYE